MHPLKCTRSVCWGLLAGLLVACAAKPPSHPEISQIIHQESVFAGNASFTITGITVLSSKLEGKKCQALLNIDFTCTRTGTWGNEGPKDPIPTGTTIAKEKNSVDATAIFIRLKGAWHLQEFIPDYERM